MILWDFMKDIPSGKLTITNIAVENGHLQLIFPSNMVIFLSYVSLPEGIYKIEGSNLSTNLLGTTVYGFTGMHGGDEHPRGLPAIVM